MGTVWVNVWEKVLEGGVQPLGFAHRIETREERLERAELLELCERAHNMGLYVLVGCKLDAVGNVVSDYRFRGVKLCERQWAEPPDWMRDSLAKMRGPDGKSLENTLIGESVEIGRTLAAIRACLEAKAIEAETKTPPNPVPRKPTPGRV